MPVKIFGKGFNYSQDGPGNRLVYHLQGCNMKCGWCANPEGMSLDGELVTESTWLFDNICPYGAITNKKLDREKCGSCSDRPCITKYRSRGINLSCKEYTTDIILDEIESCKPMFYDGGGVTFTGGEPTLQFEALEELLKKAALAGVNTAIESNASHPGIERLFLYLDHIIFDFKLADMEKHIKHTGISNMQIKRNFKKAFDSGKKLYIRIPLINNVNAAEEDILEIIGFMRENDTKNAVFELLPYHEYGKVKWINCGREYPIMDGFVDKEKVKRFEKLFNDNDLVIKRT